MKEHPILFSTEMVKANLDGRKTQTRRTKGLNRLNNDPDIFHYHGILADNSLIHVFARIWKGSWVETIHIKCPFGKPGDLLWVRESFKYIDEEKTRVDYKTQYKYPQYHTFKPSIHMPKVAARIWLQVTDIRVERLLDISNEDAIAEGILKVGEHRFKNYLKDLNEEYFLSPLPSFRSLFESIHGEQVWRQNPWVWVISFKVLSRIGKPQL